VNDHIRVFSSSKVQSANDIIAFETDIRWNELKNNMAWHNGNVIRRSLAAVMKNWDIDALSEKVSEIVSAHDLQPTFGGKCTVTPYRRQSGSLVCVLGTHHNPDVHAIEMTVTAGGLDCVYYRVFLAFRDCLHEGMFPPSDTAPIHRMYV
jgi:hypothetical protein